MRAQAGPGLPAGAVGALPVQRERFEVPDQIAYFNTANMSPLLRSVREASERGIGTRAAPWEVQSQDWFTDVEVLRERAALVFGAASDAVALVPATSYGLAVAARNLPLQTGQRVVVLHEEYPSNYYTWQRHAARSGAEVVVVRREHGQTWTDAVLAAVDERTAILAVPNVHWTDGALLDLRRVAPVAHAVGAALVIDASQSLGALPLDVADLRPDFVVSVGYKWLLGPFGVSYLYVAPQHRDGEPLEENWILRAGAEDFAALVDYPDTYLPGSRRFDVGQRTNFGLVPMAIAALDQVLRWGVSSIAATLEAVNAGIAERAGALGLNAPKADSRAPHMLGLELPRDSAERTLRALTDAQVIASLRGTSLRIAPHLHITNSDVDRLIEALSTAL
jgi:selenocysteine lyase/cysteine desulfurase